MATITTKPTPHVKGDPAQGKESIVERLGLRKSFWDWLQLLLLPVVLIGCFAWFGSQREVADLRLAEQQRVTANRLALEQQQAAILENYIDTITNMLVHDKLLESQSTDRVRAVAQAQTWTTLRQLNPERKATLLRFLYETELISEHFKVITLREADLRHVVLRGINLNEIYLYGADLRGADFRGSNISNAILSFANLSGANLEGANIHASDLRATVLTGANLKGANLRGAQNMRDDQFASAKSLSGTIMPDGSIHP
jgi:uncharacterized protein YjbI with pentapeptide repeats